MNRSVFLRLREVRRLAFRVAALVDGPANRLNRREPWPPIYMRREVGPLRTFEISAALTLAALQTCANLQPTDDLLDVGCGCAALPLIMRALGAAPMATYLGLDVDQRMIDWSNTHLADDTFSFQHYDYWSATYNPSGSRFIPFPAGDRSATIVVMKSLFTHLLPDDVDWYLRETARVLKPGGIAMISAVLYEPDDHEILTRFRHDAGDFRHERRESPESSIAIKRAWMDTHIRSAGLRYTYTPGPVQGSMLAHHLS